MKYLCEKTDTFRIRTRELRTRLAALFPGQQGRKLERAARYILSPQVLMLWFSSQALLESDGKRLGVVSLDRAIEILEDSWREYTRRHAR